MVQKHHYYHWCSSSSGDSGDSYITVTMLTLARAQDSSSSVAVWYLVQRQNVECNWSAFLCLLLLVTTKIYTLLVTIAVVTVVEKWRVEFAFALTPLRYDSNSAANKANLESRWPGANYAHFSQTIASNVVGYFHQALLIHLPLKIV